MFSNLIFFKESARSIPLALLCIFSSFSLGNLFGIYSKNTGNNFLTLFLMSTILELISFFVYSPIPQKVNFNENSSKKYFNLLKQGFLIGIFVEAFKVGS